MNTRADGGLGRILAILVVTAALVGCGGAEISGAGASTASGGSNIPSTVGDSSLTLSWSAPTENTDGSALTNLAGFDIYYGPSPNAMSQKISINTVGNLTYVIDNLSSGTWFFEVIAVNSSGVESGPSSTVSATI